MNEALAALLGRKLYLAMASAMIIPYFIASINRKRRPVYARPITETA